MKCFKTKLRPNEEQMVLLNKHCEASCFAWNWGLEIKTALYNINKEEGTTGTLTSIDLHKILVENKHEDPQFMWLNDVSKCAPQQALRNLDVAYQAAYARYKKEGATKVGWPKYKDEKSTNQSFFVENPKVCANGCIQLPRVGKIRLWEVDYVPVDMVYSSATITKAADGWYISLMPNKEFQRILEQQTPQTNSNTVVGVDMGCKTLATLSNGEKHEHDIKALKKAAHNIAKHQRRLARKQENSNNYFKQKNKLARAWLRWSRIIKDKVEKTTDALTNAYGFIGLETLDVKGMLTKTGENTRKRADANSPPATPTKRPKIFNKRGLNRSIARASMATFINRTEQKAKQRGVVVTKADQRYPSTKTCSKCGSKQDMPLDKRTYGCPVCGMIKDRDINAAINLETLAFVAAQATGKHNITTASSVGIASGAQLKTVRRSRKSLIVKTSREIMDNLCLCANTAQISKKFLDF